jgi:uncharacterized protein YgiM (DUF1202 family)
VIACAVVTPASAAQADLTTHIATVSASALRLRSGPSTESSTLDYAANGEYVSIKGKTGSWYKVSYNLTDGYMHESHLLLHDAKNVELGYGRVSGNKVNIRSGPGTSYTAVARGNAGDKAYVIGFNRQWYKVIYGDKIGYIRSDYLQLTEIPYENKDSAKAPIFFIDGKSTGIIPSANALSVGGSSTASKIVATAKQYIGVPYVWGGSSPSGFDCSGFTQYVFNKHGIALPRTTDQQYKVGSYVSRSNLKVGDLVFLQNTYREGISHVGIYVGDGKMIHASSSKGIVISDLSSSYYTKHYYGARRVL